MDAYNGDISQELCGLWGFVQALRFVQQEDFVSIVGHGRKDCEEKDSDK